MNDPFVLLRPSLFSLAYRLLGSASDADDVVQEAHVRWLAKAADVQHPRAWLERVVTNLCLDHLKSARVQREAYVGPWLPEPVETAGASLRGAPVVDLEAVSLGFLALLERLSPLERAVYVLVEAFDYAPDEVAAVLGREGAAVRQLLHRAREHVREGKPRFAATPTQHLELLGAFFAAVQAGDVKRVEGLLASGAKAVTDGGGRAKAALNVVQGAAHVARFVIGVARKAGADVRYEVREINGWPAVVGLEGDVVVSVAQLETDGARVYSLSVVLNPAKLRAVNAGR